MMRNIKERSVRIYVNCVKNANLFEKKNANIFQYLVQSIVPYQWLLSCAPTQFLSSSRTKLLKNLVFTVFLFDIQYEKNGVEQSRSHEFSMGDRRFGDRAPNRRRQGGLRRNPSSRRFFLQFCKINNAFLCIIRPK